MTNDQRRPRKPSIGDLEQQCNLAYARTCDVLTRIRAKSIELSGSGEFSLAQPAPVPRKRLASIP